VHGSPGTEHLRFEIFRSYETEQFGKPHRPVILPPRDSWQTPNCSHRKMKRLFLILRRLLIPVRLLLAFIAFCFVSSVASLAQTQIVAFGASNVEGKGVSRSQAWPAQLEAMLKAKGYNVQVKNAGKSGDTTSGMLHRLNSAVPSGTKIVILDMGGGYFNNRNTTAASQAKGKEDMAAIETQLKSRGITVIPELTSGVPLAYKQTDKIHLTPEGHKLVATYLLPKVISALGSSH
jgi:acyl-CoA thioesterase-1